MFALNVIYDMVPCSTNQPIKAKCKDMRRIRKMFGVSNLH